MSAPPTIHSRSAVLRALMAPASPDIEALGAGWPARYRATGLPSVRAGAHAVVAQVTIDDRLALKCHLASDAERARRLREVQVAVDGLDGAVVPVQHHPSALLLPTGGSTDVTVMPWIDGVDLVTWLWDHVHEPRRVAIVARAFVDVVRRLAERSLAHGDLHHGSIVVTPNDRIILLDVDGMYVPSIARLGPARRPHPHYGPPGGTQWSPAMDRHAGWTIYASLVALSHDPDLLHRVPDAGVGRLLLSSTDHSDLAAGPATQILAASGIPEVRTVAALLTSVARTDPFALPLLDPDHLPEPADRPWWDRADDPDLPRRRSQVIADHEAATQRDRAASHEKLATVRSMRRDLMRDMTPSAEPRGRDLDRHLIAIELAGQIERPVIDALADAGILTAADVTWPGDLAAEPVTLRGPGRRAKRFQLAAADQRTLGLWRDSLMPRRSGAQDRAAVSKALVRASHEETAILAAEQLKVRQARARLAVRLGALQPAPTGAAVVDAEGGPLTPRARARPAPP